MKEQEHRRSNLANSSLTPTRQRSRSRRLMMSRTERYRAQTTATISRDEPAAGGGKRRRSRLPFALGGGRSRRGRKVLLLSPGCPASCLVVVEGGWRSGGGICAGESRGMDARLPSAASFRSEGCHRLRPHQSVPSPGPPGPAARREPTSTRLLGPPLATSVPGPVRLWAPGITSRRHIVEFTD